MIRLRVRMLAPSTVIAIGSCMYAAPRKFDGPMQMPLPPRTSMRVVDDLARALGDVVLGDAPRAPPASRPGRRRAAVSVRAASIMYRLPPMRASASSMPSNLPIGVLNCLRTRA